MKLGAVMAERVQIPYITLMIVLPDELPNMICDVCKIHFNQHTDKLYGKDMWCRDVFTCRHEIKYLCPKCKHENFTKCSVCGCGEVYT